MTDPNDDLSSVADSGVPGDDEGGDLSYDDAHEADEGGLGEAADSPAA